MSPERLKTGSARSKLNNLTFSNALRVSEVAQDPLQIYLALIKHLLILCGLPLHRVQHLIEGYKTSPALNAKPTNTCFGLLPCSFGTLLKEDGSGIW